MSGRIETASSDGTRGVQWPQVRALMIKDWQLFEKQLAAYVVLGIVSLGLIGNAARWSFYAGSLLLIIVLVALACFSISNALLVERKEKTLAFVMSLPISPLDYTVAKMMGNGMTFLAPIALLWLGTIAVVMSTPVPDGFIVFATLVIGHVVLAYAVSLAAAMSVRSEGWNTFVMIATQVLINPFITWIGQIEGIAGPARGEQIIWSKEALLIISAQILGAMLIFAFTTWWHGRKPAFD
jgi:ABC-2 type transport system permease protein